MFSFKPPVESEAAEILRQEVRAFLATELAGRPARQRAESWNAVDLEFSAKLGRRGWIGMTWPRRYGGQERSSIERYVVIEELLAAGAPVGAHWIADRQSGPLLLKYGTEAQRSAILPKIAAGECFFCIGMSEPNSGSDLASVRTRARPVDGGFVVNGSKLWTTNAHLAHYMILFCRTADGERQAGTSQLLVDLKTPGITINPVENIAGDRHFNVVHFNDVFLPESCVIGEAGQGWEQVMSELAYERSGPERFLSTFPLLVEAVRELGAAPGDTAAAAIGRITAHIAVLRHLSRSVAFMLQEGENPSLQASVVKDLGTSLEQAIPEIVREIMPVQPSLRASSELPAALATSLLNAPSFSLRGGTREILRGIIARGLGLR